MSDDIEREWEETDGLSGLAGDRRRNPFPSLSATEYELFLATIRHQARLGAEQAISKHINTLCAGHRDDTDALKVVVYGSREKNVLGLDQQLDEHSAVLKKLIADIEWSKRLVYTAIVTGTVSLLFTFIFR